jgi:hypothetical protein
VPDQPQCDAQCDGPSLNGKVPTANRPIPARSRSQEADLLTRGFSSRKKESRKLLIWRHLGPQRGPSGVAAMAENKGFDSRPPKILRLHAGWGRPQSSGLPLTYKLSTRPFPGPLAAIHHKDRPIRYPAHGGKLGVLETGTVS